MAPTWEQRGEVKQARSTGQDIVSFRRFLNAKNKPYGEVLKSQRPYSPPMIRILLVLLLLTSTAWAKWPTYEFVLLGDLKLMTASDRADLKVFFRQVAQDLDRLGFPAPVFRLVKQTDGTLAYRVVLAAQDESYYADTKGDEHLIIGCTDKDTFDGGQLNYLGWLVMAHELFHGVQAAFALGQGKTPGSWITEGTADAVGGYYADKFKSSYRNAKYRTNERTLGAREYHISLATLPRPEGTKKQNDRGYKTSSFWRYLAWRAGSRTGPFGTNEDIRYLKEFFNRPILVTSDFAGVRNEVELKWLDDNLREHPKFKTGLYQLFPEFVATHSDPDYHPKLRNPSAFQARLLGEPYEMEAKVGQNSSQRILIQSTAASWVRLSMPIKANLHITAWAGRNVQDRLKAGTCLHLGILDRSASQTVSPVVADGETSKQGLVSWTLPLEQGVHYLQLTHVNPRPQDPPPSIGYNVNLGIPRNQVAVSGRSADTNGSANVAYKEKNTTISFPGQKESELQNRLQMMRVGTEENLAAPNGEMGTGLEAYAALQAELMATAGEYENEKNDFPTIRIEGLEAGQLGTFNNAEIEIRDPEFGRLSALHQEGGLRKPCGVVTVLEHSPAMLRGTYQANLVDSRMRSKGSISGSFAIPTPVRFEELDYHVAHGGDLNVDRFRSRMIPATGPESGQSENGDGDSDSQDASSNKGEAGSSTASAGSGASNLHNRERQMLLNRFRDLLAKTGLSGEELEMQLKMTDEMTLQELRQFVEFMTGQLKSQ